MHVEFSLEAKAEFEDGERYYECQVQGLGAQFRTDVRNALIRIRNWPLAAQVEQGDIRRMMLSRFPYIAIFRRSRSNLYYCIRPSASRAGLLDQP
jgi:hypothetical protein